MATERLTNGTFPSNITGWTAVENAATFPGAGVPANGDVAWTSAQSGSARIQTAFIDGTYDGALYQDIGACTPGNTMRLEVDLWRRFQGTSSAASHMAAVVWSELIGSGIPPQAMLIVRDPGWTFPKRWPLYPHDVRQSFTDNDFIELAGTFDVSQYFHSAGSYRIYLSAFLTTGSIELPRAQCFFGTVSLLDYGAPWTDAADLPATTRVVDAATENEVTCHVRT